MPLARAMIPLIRAMIALIRARTALTRATAAFIRAMAALRRATAPLTRAITPLSRGTAPLVRATTAPAGATVPLTRGTTALTRAMIPPTGATAPLGLSTKKILQPGQRLVASAPSSRPRHADLRLRRFCERHTGFSQVEDPVNSNGSGFLRELAVSGPERRLELLCYGKIGGIIGNEVRQPLGPQKRSPV